MPIFLAYIKIIYYLLLYDQHTQIIPDQGNQHAQRRQEAQPLKAGWMSPVGLFFLIVIWLVHLFLMVNVNIVCLCTL